MDSPVLTIEYFHNTHSVDCINSTMKSLFDCLCGLMLDMSGCVSALPIAGRVRLVTGGFGVLGGEGEADLPGKKDTSFGYQLACSFMYLQ